MRRLLIVALALVSISLLASCGPMMRQHHEHQKGGCEGCQKMMMNQGKPCCANLETGMGAAAQTDVRADVLYTCACGDGCHCNSMSKEPGNCSCGKPMVWGHVVKVEGDEALLCSCAQGCKCSIDPDDPSKCGCGKPVKRVSLKGTGMNFCNCGGSCTCNTVSDTPGNCGCGMKLKQSN